MNEIFKYNTLNAFLKPSTKTLIISTKAENQKSFSTEWLFEVDSILQWAFDKIEIHSILLTSDGESFTPKILKQDIALKEKDFWLKLHQKTNALNKLIARLPQTVILDCKNGNANFALDVGISADIIIGHTSGSWSFDYLEFGISPLSIHLFARENLSGGLINQWVLRNAKISHQQLQSLCIISAIYDDTDRSTCMQKILEQVFKQAPVNRIQSKLALRRTFLENLDSHILADQKILHGTLMSEEWKLWPNQKVIPNAKLPEYKTKEKFSTKKYDNVIAFNFKLEQ